MSLKKKDANKFREFSAQIGGSWKRMSGITCHICNSERQISIKTSRGLLPPTAIEKKFADLGWHVGPNENRHICPQCIPSSAKRPLLSLVDNSKQVEDMKNNSINKSQVSSIAIKAISGPVKAVVDQPRTMQREDKRIIFQKLDEVYVDDKRGYDDGWSDHRVSVDLGVPRSWIVEVREEMFGPLATNPSIDEFLSLKTEVDALRNEVSTLSALRGQLINIDDRFKKIDIGRLMDRLNHIDKLAEEVKKHIP